MEPYQKELLEKLTKQSEENAKILKTLRRHARYAMFFGFLKWSILIGPIIWAYFYLQPYFGSISQLYDTISSQVQTVSGLQEKLKGAENILRPTPKVEQQ